MKFTFPFVSTETKDGETQVNQHLLSINVRPDSKPRFIKKAIRTVVKDMYGIDISKEDAAVYYDAGVQLVRGSRDASESAKGQDVKLTDEDMRKFISRRQAVAAERLKSEK